MNIVSDERTVAYPGWRLSHADGTNAHGIEISEAHVFRASVLSPNMTAVPMHTWARQENITLALYGHFVIAPVPMEASDSVGNELRVIRQLTALSVTDVARLCGVKRRHLYNLLDGEPTESHRAARIRSIAEAVEQRASLFREAADFRSALLTPLDYQGHDFIAIVSSDEPSALAVGCRYLDAYVERLQGARPMTRFIGQTPNMSHEAITHLRELYGEL